MTTVMPKKTPLNTTPPDLMYSPLPEKVLMVMRDKRKELDETYALTEREAFIFGYAWREAMLEALEEIRNTATMLKYEHLKDTPPTYKMFNNYLERLSLEIELDNALSPFLNYQD